MDSETKISIIVTHMVFDDDIWHLSANNHQHLRENTHNPHELIFVSNASSLKYSTMLRSMCDKYVANTENLGNAKAWDQGVEVASNDIIILMDNDVWVEKDWDIEMVERLKDNTVGIVFPCSIVGEELDKQSAGLSVTYRCRRDGFCFGFRKSVYNKAGKFLCDQPFKLGYYEDDYFEYRVQYLLGYKLVGCSSSKVWHHGKGTSKKLWNEEFEKGVEANKAWYEEKANGRYPYLVD